MVEDNIDITGENYNGQLVDFEIEDNCYVNNKFIGTTVAKKITVNILNPNNEINLENKEIQAFVGINNEYVPFGNFIIQKPDNKEVQEKTNFIGYDYMIKFNVSYKDRVDYPIKAGLLFKDVCEQVGLETGNLSFINSEYMILGNPFTNNEDCRTVLSNLAQLAGGFAKIGRDNKVYIITLKNISNLLTVKYVNAMTVKELNLTMVKALSAGKDNADEKIDGNNYFTDFSKNEQWGELNSLVLGLSSIEGENVPLDDKTSIEENGLTEIQINDNYFLIDKTEREKVIVPIWNTLKGIKYLPFKTNYYGYPYLDCGDMIYIQDSKDVGYVSYVFNHTFKFNGGFSGILDTPAMTKTQTAYKNTFDLKTKFKNAERKIDKINGIIEDIVKEQTETSQKLTQHEQTIDAITNRVEQIEDVTNTVEGIETIALGNCMEGELLELHIYGNNTVFDYLYPSDDLYPSDNLYPYGDSRIVVNDKVYELGITDVLRQNGEVQDEFILLDGQAKVIRRINKDGTIKTTETIEDLGELKISLQEGTNIITIKNYTAKLSARFAIKNEYTEVFATRVEMNSSITQTANEIKSEVRKKVDEDEVCSTISQSAEEILLKGNRVLIDSDNFKLEKNGDMTCSNATLTKGTLKFYDSHGTWVATQSVTYVGDIGQEALHLQIQESDKPSLLISFENNPLHLIKASRISTNRLENMSTSSGYAGFIEIGSAAKLSNLLVNTIQPSETTSPQINFTADIYTPKRVLGSEFVNVSEKRLKENIHKLKGNSKKKTITRKALDIVENTDICEYNFKGNEHKQIGVIIGNGYNTPDEILSEDKKGVDLYTMISILYKAFQEQNEEIQNLKERLNKYEK